MAYRAKNVAQEPLNYFLQSSDEGPHWRVADVVVRANQDPKEIFSRLIRLATNSHWSHTALLYLINDPSQGFDNTFLVEAMTNGIRVASWRNEVEPFEKFNVGIRRLPLDWYAETPQEKAGHNHDDPEDVPGIAYLRHVRGMAVDQINSLYDNAVVDELTALYIERVVKRRLPEFPILADLAATLAHQFEKWDEDKTTSDPVMRFICSGLVQYSFFAALRWRIINALAVQKLEYKDAAMSNLDNMERIIFRPDLEGLIPDYIQQVKSGKLKIDDPVPPRVLDLLKTTTPADFNNSLKLEWRYIIRDGKVWQIDATAPDGYKPQSQDEADILDLMAPEHSSQDPEM